MKENSSKYIYLSIFSKVDEIMDLPGGSTVFPPVPFPITGGQSSIKVRTRSHVTQLRLNYSQK